MASDLRIRRIQSIYERLKKTVEEEREDVIEATMGGGDKGTISSNRLESLYNRWLKKTDES